MPILASGDATGSDLVAVARAQGIGAVRPIGYEVPRMSAAMLVPLATEARRQRVRLWSNSLWEGFVADFGGDLDALRDPPGVWGRLIDAGVSMIQTDEPEALLAYLATRRR